MESLTDARKFVYDNLDEGITCPCCEQYARRYRRKFNSTMGRSLLWLVNEWRGLDIDWIDVARTAPRWLVRSNQLPTVRWWGLAERPLNDDPKRKHSGLWRPTKRGVRFASGMITLPAYAVTYRGNVENLDGGPVYIQDTLGKHFNYTEIMGG